MTNDKKPMTTISHLGFGIWDLRFEILPIAHLHARQLDSLQSTISIPRLALF
jgi:hypothetical protein